MKLDWEDHDDDIGGQSSVAQLEYYTYFEIDWLLDGFFLYYIDTVEGSDYVSYQLGNYKTLRAAKCAAAWMLRNRKPPYTKAQNR